MGRVPARELNRSSLPAIFLSKNDDSLNMECKGNCREFCSWIETLPCHVRYTLPRESLPKLPECFRETILGEMVDGAGRQLRGPHGSHVHEFPDRWVLHRDLVDAGKNPIGHLLRDAPEYPTSLLLGALAGLAIGRRSRNKAMLAAGLASTLALVSGKMVKLLNGDPSDGHSEGPKRASKER